MCYLTLTIKFALYKFKILPGVKDVETFQD